MTEVRICCAPEVAAGFRLAGLPVVEARDPGEAREAVAAVPDALWLVQDTLAPRLSGTLVVPFPGPEWDPEVHQDRVLEILRRAIGYRVRL